VQTGFDLQRIDFQSIVPTEYKSGPETTTFDMPSWDESCCASPSLSVWPCRRQRSTRCCLKLLLQARNPPENCTALYFGCAQRPLDALLRLFDDLSARVVALMTACAGTCCRVSQSHESTPSIDYATPQHAAKRVYETTVMRDHVHHVHADINAHLTVSLSVVCSV